MRKIILTIALIFFILPIVKANNIDPMIQDNCYINDGEETYVQLNGEILCISNTGKLIFVSKDENITDITDDISKYLNGFLPQESTYLEPFFPKEVRFDNLSPDNNKYFAEFYTGQHPYISFALGCVIKIPEMERNEQDYFYCPSISNPFLLNSSLDLDSSDNLLPNGYFGGGLKEWTDDSNIQMSSNNGTLLLDLEEKTLSDVEGDIVTNIFSDVSINHPLYFLTKIAQNQGWISGYPDSTFKPEKSVNRAEFAKMLIIAFSRGDGNKNSLSRFPDVQTDQWYTPYLSRAVELKIMEGYPDGTMKPGNTIIKAEALKMALEMLDNDYESNAGEPWYEKYRRYAGENLNLDFTSTEDMDKQMSRGGCVELILDVVGQGS